MSDDQSTPVGWYADPLGVAELRYWEGTAWTEHVSTGGVQGVSPMGTRTSAVDAAESPLGTGPFTVARGAQAREGDEQGLEVRVAGGAVARFVPTLEGAPGYRLVDPSGAALLTLSKPGLKSAVVVEGPSGDTAGTINKIGRLHSRYDLAGPEGTPLASAKLATGTDRWEVRPASGAVVAAVARVVTIPADGLALAGVSYSVSVTSEDASLRPLLVALPVAIDILDTQV